MLKLDIFGTKVRHKETDRQGIITHCSYVPHSYGKDLEILYVVVSTVIAGELISLHVEGKEFNEWENIS